MPVHFIMQSKGGAGKSTVAAYLYQYLQQRGEEVHGFDIDPSNHTFGGYKALDVSRIEVMSGNDIDQRKFDALIESIVALPQASHMVVDVGASGFAQLCAYVIENEIFPSLADLGHVPVIHSIVVGGAAVLDSVSSLKTLANNFQNVPLVVWVNTYFGPALYKGIPYYDFFDWKNELAPVIKAMVQLPVKSASTFGVDLREMAARRLSFEQIINGEGDAAQAFGIMPRQRLKTYWRELYEAIDRTLPPVLAGL